MLTDMQRVDVDICCQTHGGEPISLGEIAWSDARLFASSGRGALLYRVRAKAIFNRAFRVCGDSGCIEEVSDGNA